jgi:hypothetical protein
MLKYACVHNMFGVTSQPRRLRTAVQAALDVRDDRDPRDLGAEQLALRYAALVDEAKGTADEVKVAGDLGPKLLAALAALGLTPAARQEAVKGGPSGTEHRSPLDELRARRAARQHNAKAVDTATS